MYCIVFSPVPMCIVLCISALEETVAERLGFESALFVPTGTMANLIASTSQRRQYSYIHTYLVAFIAIYACMMHM